MSTVIKNLQPDQIEEAADLLAEASLMDPLMGYIFGSDLDVRRRAIKNSMGMLCRIRIGQNDTVLTVEDDGRLAAVACIALPGRDSWPIALEEAWGRMEGTIGGDATERFVQYRELHQRHGLDNGHVYLDVLGVHRNNRGQGLSDLLLEHIAEMASNHGHSIGLALDTSNPANLEYYGERGFGVKASEWLGTNRICFMFRGNG